MRRRISTPAPPPAAAAGRSSYQLVRYLRASGCFSGQTSEPTFYRWSEWEKILTTYRRFGSYVPHPNGTIFVGCIPKGRPRTVAYVYTRTLLYIAARLRCRHTFVVDGDEHEPHAVLISTNGVNSTHRRRVITARPIELLLAPPHSSSSEATYIARLSRWRCAPTFTLYYRQLATVPLNCDVRKQTRFSKNRSVNQQANFRTKNTAAEMTTKHSFSVMAKKFRPCFAGGGGGGGGMFLRSGFFWVCVFFLIPFRYDEHSRRYDDYYYD